jgi:hypothetical protein
MKLIFECETELGRCDADRVNGHFGDDPSGWIAFVYTSAAMTRANGLLRVEQRCYFRSTDRLNEVRSQNWIKPEMTLEPVLASKDKTMAAVQALHDTYVQRARESFIEQSILIAPAGAWP